jgi:hypothetical protein
LRSLFDDGHPLVSAALIVRLEDALAAANAEVATLREQMGGN